MSAESQPTLLASLEEAEAAIGSAQGQLDISFDHRQDRLEAFLDGAKVIVQRAKAEARRIDRENGTATAGEMGAHGATRQPASGGSTVPDHTVANPKARTA